MLIVWSWREKIFEESNLKLDHPQAIWRLMCMTPIVIEVVWDRLLLWRTGIALDCHSRRYCKIARRQRQRVRGRTVFGFVVIIVLHFAFLVLFCLYFLFFVIISKYCKLRNMLGKECFVFCISRCNLFYIVKILQITRRPRQRVRRRMYKQRAGGWRPPSHYFAILAKFSFYGPQVSMLVGFYLSSYFSVIINNITFEITFS